MPTNGLHLEEVEMEVIDLKNELNVEVGDVTLNYQLTTEEQETLSEEKFKSRQRKKKKQKPAKPKPKAAIPQRTPILNSSKQNGSKDFGIFLAFSLLTLAAFYMGLNSAHRASIDPSERLGRSLWKYINKTSVDK